MAAAAAAPDAQKQLQSLSESYQQLQTELSKSVQARQTLTAQQTENASVARELAGVPAGAPVYKAIGPVLLRQEHGEARAAVDARLEYIKGEIARVEASIGEVQKRVEGVRGEIGAVQAQAQGQGGA